MKNKKTKAHLINPLSLNPYCSPAEFLTPSSDCSKASIFESNDIEAIKIYLESLKSWLNGYFFSKVSSENLQLPCVSTLENTELYEICNSLRATIAKVREIALKNIKKVESKHKASTENIKLSPHSKSKSPLKIEILEKKLKCLFNFFF